MDNPNWKNDEFTSPNKYAGLLSLSDVVNRVRPDDADLDDDSNRVGQFRRNWIKVRSEPHR